MTILPNGITQFAPKLQDSYGFEYAVIQKQFTKKIIAKTKKKTPNIF